jgi:cell division protein FtsX
VTGGPQRTPVPPRSSGCGGGAVNVTVKASALGSSSGTAATTEALRTISSDLLAPVRGAVGAPSISPAIRAFRVRVTDPSATQRVLAQLRASPKVENVELDDCAVMIKR